MLVLGFFIQRLLITIQNYKFKMTVKFPTIDENEFKCFTANPDCYVTDEHVRLGYVFEYMAVGEIEHYFKKIYKKAKFSTMMSPITFAKIREKYLRTNLIIIGGPIHNQVAKKLLEKKEIPFQFDSDSNLLFLKNGVVNKKYIPEKTAVEGCDYFQKDYALIINAKNPWDNSKRIIALMGCRSLGCYGASLFLCNEIYKCKNSSRIRDDEYALVVSCYGEEENITSNPELVGYYQLHTKNLKTKTRFE